MEGEGWLKGELNGNGENLKISREEGGWVDLRRYENEQGFFKIYTSYKLSFLTFFSTFQTLSVNIQGMGGGPNQ